MKKTYKPTAAQIAERDAFDEMAKLLSGEIEEGKHTERVKQIAKDVPGLGRFSELNRLLILQQMPEATEVHTYIDWQVLGYQVREGEKSRIRVRSPRTGKGDNGEQQITGMQWKKEFDISQVDKIEVSE